MKIQKTNKINIAILDSGINIEHTRFSDLDFINQVSVLDNQFELLNPHGTCVMDCIRKCIDNVNLSLCKFIDIQIVKNNIIEEKNLINGIETAIRLNATIINLSLGLINDEPTTALYEICKKAHDQGVIIVASTDNNNHICYPAQYDFIYGVGSGIIENPSSFSFDNEKTIQFLGKGVLQRVAGLNQDYHFVSGTSFATGHITGIITNILIKHGISSYQELNKILLEKSKKFIKIGNSNTSDKSLHKHKIEVSKDEIINKYFNPELRRKKLGAISVYPFSNKEFSALKYFPELNPHKIVNILDYPKKAILNKKIKLNGEIYINHWNLTQIKPDFDTFVIGYPNEIALEVNNKFYEQIIQYCCKHRKNVFALDPSIKKDFGSLENIESGFREISFYCPELLHSDAEELRKINDLGAVTKPVLGVIGSTPKSGKFTLQLKIKKVLERNGYSLGWISTEPQGELFGADFCFSYGYKSGVNIDYSLWPKTIKSIIKGIERYKDPDMILSGHQSSLIQHYKNAYTDDVLRNVAFFNGLCADTMVCALNYSDEIDLIKRLQSYVKSFYQIDILFFALNTVNQEVIPSNNTNLPPLLVQKNVDKTSWKNKATKIEKTTGIPVINIFDEKDDKLILSQIESFFS